MIIGIIGNLGTGKTLGMTFLGAYFMNETHYDRVVTNYDTDITTDRVNNPKELDDKTQSVEGIYLLDEVWAWADSRDSMDNDLMTEIILNSRKRGCTIIYTTQNLHQVDRRLRGSTDYIAVANHKESFEIDKDNNQGVLYMFDKNLEPVRTFKFNAEMWYDTYDTTEEVSTVKDAKAYEELMEEYKKRVERGEFETKKELRSHIKLNEQEISGSMADDMTTEIFRQIKGE